METPVIQLRRNPVPALIILVVGLGIAGAGILFSQLLVTFMGILPIMLAGLMMLNPLAVIGDEEVELRNLFGVVGARHGHDGLHKVEVIGNLIFIHRGEMRAPLTAIAQNRVHGRDWEAMLKILEQVKALRKGK